MRPIHDLTVVPVLSASGGRVSNLAWSSRAARGQEREIAVLFCDLRGFTNFAEKRLPFDTVFILNRYFEVVGHAIEEAGGTSTSSSATGCWLCSAKHDPGRSVPTGGRGGPLIRRGIAALNETIASELDRPLQVAMSLHAGPAIVGEMGYGQATSLTAVGDTLNAASRLEGLAKDVDAELVISDDVVERAGLDLVGHDRQTLTVRGRSTPITAWIISEAGAIAPLAARDRGSAGPDVR